MAFQHEPVLLQEVIRWMNVREGGVYCDGTLGGGGHSEAILKTSCGTASLYGIDRDETAIHAASERLRRYPGFHAIRGNFHDGKALLEEAGAGPLDGVLLRVLRAVLAGEDAAGILREEHLLPSVAADRINEALYDVFGDTVLLSEEDRLSPAEDYREELERMLGGCSDG